MGRLAILGRSGDTQMSWAAENTADVEAARKTFDDLTGRGYAAFAVGAEGAKGERVRRFDPAAEKIIVVPPLVGGSG